MKSFWWVCGLVIVVSVFGHLQRKDERRKWTKSLTIVCFFYLSIYFRYIFPCHCFISFVSRLGSNWCKKCCLQVAQSAPLFFAISQNRFKPSRTTFSIPNALIWTRFVARFVKFSSKKSWKQNFWDFNKKPHFKKYRKPCSIILHKLGTIWHLKWTTWMGTILGHEHKIYFDFYFLF